MNQTHPVPTAPPLRWLAPAALAVVSVLGLGACGDDDASSPDETPTEVQTDDGSPSDEDEGSDQTSDGETDAGADLGLETRAEAMAAGLDAESYEVVDDSTVRFVLSSGTSEGPVNSDCMAAEAVLDDIEITMVYPDGEVVC